MVLYFILILYSSTIVTCRCALCQKCFLTSNKLKYHIRRTHLPIDEGQFECVVCDKRCKNLRLLLNHQKCHIQIVCMVCKKQISASNYDQHVRSVHVIQTAKKRKPINKNDESNKKKKVNDKSTPTSSSSTSNKPSNVHNKLVSRVSRFGIHVSFPSNWFFFIDVHLFDLISELRQHRAK